MSLADAIAADRAGDVQGAAGAYEACIIGGERSLVALLNLAILYWQATDFGLSSAKNLSIEFVADAGRRFPTLLAEAQSSFPESTEVEFWRRYITWADLGEDFSIEECRELLQRAPTTLVPAMYLFAQSKGQTSQEEALELLRQCQEDSTTRSKYVMSVLEGVLKRKRREPG